MTIIRPIIIIIRLRRCRSAEAYSRQTFPWTICRSVRLSICLSSALWKNGASDPDAVWHHRSDGSRDEAGTGAWGSVHGKGYFWGEFVPRHCNQWGLYGVRMRQRREAALFPNYFGQTYYYYRTVHMSLSVFSFLQLNSCITIKQASSRTFSYFLLGLL